MKGTAYFGRTVSYARNAFMKSASDGSSCHHDSPGFLLERVFNFGRFRSHRDPVLRPEVDPLPEQNISSGRELVQTDLH